MLFHNPELRLLARDRYDAGALRAIEAALRSHGALTFDRLPSGLFPACRLGAGDAQSGYDNVWIRDNVYIAYAHLVSGAPRIAADTARALLEFQARQRRRFDDIIAGVTDPADVASRPQVRFDGRTLAEIDGLWAHAQNDALGYLLWLGAQLVRNGYLDDERSLSVLRLLPRYFAAIRYWEDEDSGHWEETRKISASSIGAVVAGLESFLSCPKQFDDALLQLAGDASRRGREALAAILPNECAQLDPEKNRRYDAALVFLLYPLGVIDGPLAELVLHDVDSYLAGDVGIRRYLRDSFWAPDYETRLGPAERTRDYSRDMAARDALIHDVGGEAQWCIFDPLLSAYDGRAGRPERQVHHFNRTLAQITASWQCPELYYRKGGKYTPGPQSPLQWTQANLLVALQTMKDSSHAERQTA
ncbi:MAG TPA: glycoside hydrolase family 15 protein [Thermoanaerobaculia bacterium]|nr:glycoside hydrolase family 15 protein [Thermoanaerobaculia bacterium]